MITQPEALQTIDRFVVDAKRAPKPRCETCGGPTKEGKPYCSKHVVNQPYVANLLKELEEREKQQELAAKCPKKIKENFYVCEDILHYLRVNGAASTARIARTLALPDPEFVDNHVKVLKRKKQVVAKKSRRGYTIVVLKGEEELLEDVDG